MTDVLIAAEIKKNGPMSFARFMELALYAPNAGYYRTSNPKFGPQGDFITAPEISSLFGSCFAHQCHQIFKFLPTANILEFGAGSGALAVDLLTELEQLNALPGHYYILEVSGYLRQLQRETIQTKCAHLMDRVIWLDTLPTDFIGVIVANEVLDAMPVHKFCVTHQKIQEFYVIYQNKAYAWELKEANGPLKSAVKKLNILHENYSSEINLYLAPWIKSLSDALTQGVILLCDYGFPAHEYYHADRWMGTLMCHHRHLAHDNPLIHVGQQDITAHVDFTAVAEAALGTELNVLGFTNQAAFLMNTGLTQYFEKQFNLCDTAKQLTLGTAMKKLTLPTEMGELFKVMALGKGIDEDLAGFVHNDQRVRL